MFPVDTDVNVVALKRVTFSIGMFKREWKKPQTKCSDVYSNVRQSKRRRVNLPDSIDRLDDKKISLHVL